jgi:hypothetical protein
LLLSAAQAALIAAAIILAWFLWLRPSIRPQERTIIESSDSAFTNTARRPDINAPASAFTNTEQRPNLEIPPPSNAQARR